MSELEEKKKVICPRCKHETIVILSGNTKSYQDPTQGKKWVKITSPAIWCVCRMPLILWF